MHPDIISRFEPCHDLVHRQLLFVLDRYRRSPGLRFIDTKYHLLRESEFDPDTMGSPIYGRDIVYGYIQGRGLEALAGHLAWLQACPGLSPRDRDALRKRILTILHEVSASLETLRRRNRGHLYFIMRRDGTPLRVTDDLDLVPLTPAPRAYSFSDLFAAKGLYAAGKALRRPALAARGRSYFRRCVQAVRADTFVPGHQVLRRGPRPPEDPGSRGHGPYMIALGGVSLLLTGTRRGEWLEAGRALLQHVAGAHIQRSRRHGLEPFDFVERIDRRNRPVQIDGRILCDPGHALECTGLACKFILSAGTQGCDPGLKHGYSRLLSGVARQVFALGFNSRAQGIRKTVDLLSRQPVNDEMPWWSLPETMRAAALLITLRPRREHDALLEMFRLCREALLNRYIRRGPYALACQTRNSRGRPVDRIPAVPDLDPCYHTGLSLIDILQY